MKKHPFEDLLVIVGVLILFFVILLNSNKSNTPRYNPKSRTSSSKKVISSLLSGTKLQYDYPYQRGEVSYEVERGNTYNNGQSIIGQTYYVIYVNLSSRPMTIYSSSLNIGCIEADNQKYIYLDSPFGTSLSQPLTLPPFYNPITVNLNVPGNCQYLGTENDQYYWIAE